MRVTWTGQNPWQAAVSMGVVSLFCLTGTAAAEYAGAADRPALDQALARYEAKTQISDSLRITGSETMQPLLSRLAAEFNRRQPNAKISVEGRGSAAALPEFLARPAKAKLTVAPPWDRKIKPQTSLFASSRSLVQAEIDQFTASHGYEPTAVPIARDAVAIYVHKDNPLPGLTLDQVDAIFSSTRKRGYAQDLTSWGQLGLAGQWEDAPIRLYGRNQKSGTRGFVKEHVLAHGEFKASLQEEPGTASVILAVSRDPLGMGFSGMGLAASSVRAVPLAEGEGMPFVQPTAKTVMDGSYPLGRLLYLYLDQSPGAPLPQIIEEFLSFVKSREGQEAVIKAGFYPLANGQVEQHVAAVERTQGR